MFIIIIFDKVESISNEFFSLPSLIAKTFPLACDNLEKHL